jgi:hypothetical protein
VTRVDELKRIHAEGRAADVGAPNPYRGQLVNAAVWRGGYRRMLDDMLAKSPARQAYLRRRGYRRGGPDRPLVINRHSGDDEPVYLWADVRKCCREVRAEGGRTMGAELTEGGFIQYLWRSCWFAG